MENDAEDTQVYISASQVKMMQKFDDGALGRGNFQVHKCLVNDEVRAVKIFEYRGSRDQIQDAKMALSNEINALKKAKPSPYVVAYDGIVEYKYFSAGVIMEYMPRGNLYDFVCKYKPSFLLRVGALRDIASGLKYLHHSILPDDYAVTHNDLKPQNVLLSADLTAKICDFEGSDVVARTSAVARCKVPPLPQPILTHSPHYSPPELLDAMEKNEYNIVRSRSMDIFSFSMAIYFMHTGNDPFYRLISNSVEKCYRDGIRPEIQQYDFESTPEIEHMISALNKLMTDCWEHNPKNRPTAARVVETLQGLLDENSEDKLNAEKRELIERYPLDVEDKSNFSKPFGSFCDENQSQKTSRASSDESEDDILPHKELKDNFCKATSTALVHYIKVDKPLDDVQQGDHLYVEAPNETYKCKVTKVLS